MPENSAPGDTDAARAYWRQREAERRARREVERQAWVQRASEAILRVAPLHPAVGAVYLFGSLVQPGRFRPDSDVDVAVVCDSLEDESAFWRALERELKRDVDVRPLEGAVAEAVRAQGVLIYERQDIDPAEQHPPRPRGH